jgi:uncharacterized protein YcbK (DUF882 family)
LALLFFFSGSKALQNAVAEGDTRTISMHHLHTGEDITITYKRNGRYDEAALEKLNWFLRDWRRGQQTRMDPHLIDLVWDAQRDANAKEPIQVVCGYRAPQTNAMLRRRSGGVARFSQHMLGHAMDFYIPGVPLEQLREIGLRLQRGGVGFYPTSGSPFVHMDTGGVRMWPRMTHEELARVFPDGRTVHIPSDGKPLPGYALTLADLKKRGGMPSELSLDAARAAGVNVGTVVASDDPPVANPFAKLLWLAHDEDEDEDVTPRSVVVAQSAPAGAQSKPAIAASNPPALASVEPVNEPAKPKLVQVVELMRPASSAAQPSDATPSAAETANQIIRARGYWQGPPDGMAVTPGPPSAPSREGSRKTHGEKSGVIGPFSDPHQRSGAQVTLAYAEQPPAHPSSASSPAVAGVAVLRTTATSAQPQIRAERALSEEHDGSAEGAIPTGTTIAVKRVAHQAGSVILSATASSVIAIKTGIKLQNPWLRAVLVAPSVHRFLTTLALGAHDFRTLAALMVKPRSSVMMTFAADPNPGLEHERFSGPAVVFVSTISYPTARTATLQ